MQTTESTVVEKAEAAAIKGINFIIAKLNNIDEETPTVDVILWTEKLSKMLESLKTINKMCTSETNAPSVANERSKRLQVSV